MNLIRGFSWSGGQEWGRSLPRWFTTVRKCVVAFSFGLFTGSAVANVSVNDASIVEGNSGTKKLNFTVTRTGDTTKSVSVTVQSGEAPTSPATPVFDYTTLPATKVLIPHGQSTATASVSIRGDTESEADEKLLLHVTGAVEGIADHGARLYPLGVPPQDVEMADLNDDGKADLVAVAAPNKLAVMLGSGHDLFQAPVLYTVGTTPLAVAVRDINDDSRLDLVTVNQGDSSVSVLLGNGDGSFAPVTSYAAGPAPVAVAIGDLNGDGKPDLVTANSGGLDSISVLLGNGDGSFGSPWEHQVVANGPSDVVIADFNGDDKADLAVTHGAGTFVSVLNGIGDGSFAYPPAYYGTGMRPKAITIGFVNGDTVPDLVTGNLGNQFVAPDVSVLLGNADGSFGAAISAFTAYPAVDVAIADVNADGIAELVAITQASSPDPYAWSLAVLSGPGDGTFFSLNVYYGGLIAAVAVGDLNGDLKPDLAVATQGGNGIAVLPNTGSGQFASPLFAADAHTHPVAVASGDLNGDGNPELIVANEGSSDVSVLLGFPGGGFFRNTHYPTGSAPRAIAAGDVNADGKIDVVTANSGGNNVSVLLGNGNGTLAAAINYSAGTGSQALALRDFNADSKLDIVTGNAGGDVSVLLGVGDGTFDAPISFVAGTNVVAVAAADLNGDTKQDLVTANKDGNNVSVLFGNGNGTFAAAVTHAVGTGPTGVAIGDLDGDGDRDVVVSNGGSDNVSVLINASDGSFADAVTHVAGNTPVAVALADLDGDTRPDIVTADQKGGVSTLLNIGDGSFTDTLHYLAGYEPSSLAVADFNGDSQPDIAVANREGGNVLVLYAAAGVAAIMDDNEGVGTILDDDDLTPNPFSFTDVSQVALNAAQTSNTITVTGINTATPISVVGGFYALNGEGTCLRTSGTVQPNALVRVCHVSADAYNSTTSTALTIGADGVLMGVSDTFSSTTLSDENLDTTPNAFKFTDQSNVSLNVVLVSNAVTISGLSAPAAISVSGKIGSEYSIGCNGTFTRATGTVTNGQRVCVRHTSANTPKTAANTTLNIGGNSGVISDTFTSITLDKSADGAPDQFKFVDKTNVGLGAVQISNTITIAGITTGAPISVTGGDYSIGCNGNFTSINGTIYPGQKVCVRHTSAGTANTPTNTTLTIGAIADEFRSTTVATADTTPNAFKFTDKINVNRGVMVTSNAITITGINTAASIGVSGAFSSAYSIGCNGSFTNASGGSILPGQKVCVQHISDIDANEPTLTTLTVGTGPTSQATFKSTTTTDTLDRSPNPFKFAEVKGVSYSSIITSSSVVITGINTGVVISVDNGEWSLGCNGSFTPDPGMIYPGEKVCVRHTSSASALGQVTTTLTVGTAPNHQATFKTTATDKPVDNVPNPFKFADKGNVAHGIPLTSNAITVTGINTSVPISVTGTTGSAYSIGCNGSFTSAAGTISPSDKVCVRHTTAAQSGAWRNTTLTLGSGPNAVSDTFSSLTRNSTETTP